MARRWTTEEEQFYRNQLLGLYVAQNLTIGEIGRVLGVAESTVFDRMQRLGVASIPERKPGYCRRSEVIIPESYSEELAEFLGIMLGDGHISHFQTVVTLGSKELEYVEYVADLMQRLFNARGTICVRKNGYRDVYIGSVALTAWLKEGGLVNNKVTAQVGVPSWIQDRPVYQERFIRGFFDTDGSVYRLRFGRQISFTNMSRPLLDSLREMLSALQYKPSLVSAHRVYLTRKDDVDRFFAEIAPANRKHVRRYELFTDLTRR